MLSLYHPYTGFNGTNRTGTPPLYHSYSDPVPTYIVLILPLYRFRGLLGGVKGSRQRGTNTPTIVPLSPLSGTLKLGGRNEVFLPGPKGNTTGRFASRFLLDHRPVCVQVLYGPPAGLRPGFVWTAAGSPWDNITFRGSVAGGSPTTIDDHDRRTRR